MSDAVTMAELWRGDRIESLHRGHAVIVDASGAVVRAWGDPGLTMYPRSSCKMIQALPLVESGAELTTEQLALLCASHNGAAIHTDRVGRWLADLGLSESDLRCGTQMPDDRDAREGLIRAGHEPCQIHNNCSGKHTGFLMQAQRLGGGPEYVEPDHPVQQAVRAAFEEVTEEASPGYGIDGCSAPNFATSLTSLARAMARFAAAEETDARGTAMVRLRQAMVLHPELVAGEGRACTELMRAMDGIAVKIEDGTTRASECALTAILCGMGVLDPEHPATRRRMNVIQTSRRGIECGILKPGAALAA